METWLVRFYLDAATTNGYAIVVAKNAAEAGKILQRQGLRCSDKYLIYAVEKFNIENIYARCKPNSIIAEGIVSLGVGIANISSRQLDNKVTLNFSLTDKTSKSFEIILPYTLQELTEIKNTTQIIEAANLRLKNTYNSNYTINSNDILNANNQNVDNLLKVGVYTNVKKDDSDDKYILINTSLYSTFIKCTVILQWLYSVTTPNVAYYRLVKLADSGTRFNTTWTLIGWAVTAGSSYDIDSTNNLLKVYKGSDTYVASVNKQIDLDSPIFSVDNTITTDGKITITLNQYISNASYQYKIDSNNSWKTVSINSQTKKGTIDIGNTANWESKNQLFNIILKVTKLGVLATYELALTFTRKLSPPSISVSGTDYSTERNVQFIANSSAIVKNKRGEQVGDETIYNDKNYEIYADPIEPDTWLSSDTLKQTVIVGKPYIYSGLTKKIISTNLDLAEWIEENLNVAILGTLKRSEGNITSYDNLKTNKFTTDYNAYVSIAYDKTLGELSFISPDKMNYLNEELWEKNILLYKNKLYLVYSTNLASYQLSVIYSFYKD